MPALAGAATLLPWRPRPGVGLVLQLLALIALLGVPLLPARAIVPVVPLAVVLTLVATLAWTVGRQLSIPGLRHRLHAATGLSERLLRGGDGAGRLLGTLLAGVLFPLGRALAQFSVALTLLLPLLPVIGSAGSRPMQVTGSASDRSDPRGRDTTTADARTADTAPVAWPRARRARTDRAGNASLRGALMLGLLFGGLFALLPLWVRQEGRGSCFDFGMLLSAFTVGRLLADLTSVRTVASGLFRWRAGAVQHGLMGLLLLLSTRIPGWGAVSLFVPFGVLAELLEQPLRPALGSSPLVPADVEGFERARALGGLIGTLTMGLITQAIGLFWAWPLQVGAFALAALLWRPGPSREAALRV